MKLVTSIIRPVDRRPVRAIVRLVAETPEDGKLLLRLNAALAGDAAVQLTQLLEAVELLDNKTEAA